MLTVFALQYLLDPTIFAHVLFKQKTTPDTCVSEGYYIIHTDKKSSTIACDKIRLSFSLKRNKRDRVHTNNRQIRIHAFSGRQKDARLFIRHVVSTVTRPLRYTAMRVMDINKCQLYLVANGEYPYIPYKSPF